MTSAKISVKDASIDFPIYNGLNKSIKNSIINATVGGYIKKITILT